MKKIIIERESLGESKNLNNCFILSRGLLKSTECNKNNNKRS